MERIQWIDFVRGIAMLAILLFHTEVYYAEHTILSYHSYVPSALMAFAFVSGYLFDYKQQPFSIRHKLKAILRSLIIPYFLFATIILLGKWILGHSNLSLGDLLIKIITGQASWYIAALILAEILFAVIMKLTREKRLAMVAVCLVFYILLSIFHNSFGQSFRDSIPNWWRWQEALLILMFLSFGDLYRHYEKRLSWLNTNWALIVLVAISVALKIVVYQFELQMLVADISISYYSIFLIDGILISLLIVNIARRLPKLTLITFIGRNSLIVYFLSGTIPLFVSMVFNRIGLHYNDDYLRVVLVYIFVVDFSTISAYLISRYFWKPFINWLLPR